MKVSSHAWKNGASWGSIPSPRPVRSSSVAAVEDSGSSGTPALCHVTLGGDMNGHMNKDTENLIIVSGDSHAVPPPSVWPDYVDAEFHDYLPAMREDNERYTELLGLFAKFSPELLEVIDTEGIWQAGGW